MEGRRTRTTRETRRTPAGSRARDTHRRVELGVDAVHFFAHLGEQSHRDAREGRRRRLARFSRESRGGESRDRACACRARVEVTTEGSGRRSEYTRAICLLICLNDENIDVCARVSAIRIQRCTAVCQNSYIVESITKVTPRARKRVYTIRAFRIIVRFFSRESKIGFSTAE